MNFKRFGRTANLFDKSNGSYNAYVDDAGTWRYVDTAKSVKILCAANATYTLSVPENLSVFRIYEVSDALAEPPVQAAEIVRSGGIDRYTFTTASTTAAIIFQGSAGDFEEWFNGLMMNAGSTALPYQPYKGWTNIPHYIHNTSTDTITTLPADIYANDTTATVGLKGNMEQSGTPTPTTPIQPSECGERTGNLCDVTGATSGYIKADGEIVTGHENLMLTDYIAIPSEAETLTQSYGGSLTAMNAPALCFFNGNKEYISGESFGNLYEKTFTVPNNAKYIRTCYRTTMDWVMLNTGSTALPYEPYGVKIPILSGGTITPIYLGEVQTTRRIKKFVLTGEESGTWSYSTILRNGNGFYNQFIFTGYKANSGAGYCTHYPLATALTDTIGVLFGSNINFITDFAEGIDTADKWKTYLQQQYANGTPVTIWYVLDAPETGIVNEPLRKIGDYADTVSGITIPTTTGKDSFDVLTTLKPSEVSLAYTGWHDATVKEWDGSEWQ